jgi:hypothetical protein
MSKLQELFNPFDLDDNTFEDELEQYDYTEPEDDNFDELFSDIEDEGSYDATEFLQEPSFDDDSSIDIDPLFESIYQSSKKKLTLKEGGHRRHISQELKDKFIHAVLIIPDPSDRQTEIDAIFEEIRQKNSESYMKEHPELQAEQNENLREGQATTLDGGWQIKTRKGDGKGVYDLLIKGPTGEVGEFEEFFWYTQGYDQVFSGPTKAQYYLQSKIGYNAGNGGGRPTPGSPWISRGLEKRLTELLNEDGLDGVENAIKEHGGY